MLVPPSTRGSIVQFRRWPTTPVVAHSIAFLWEAAVDHKTRSGVKSLLPHPKFAIGKELPRCCTLKHQYPELTVRCLAERLTPVLLSTPSLVVKKLPSVLFPGASRYSCTGVC